MTTTEICEKLRKVATCVYIVVEKTVADDIADACRQSADLIEQQARRIEALMNLLDRARKILWCAVPNNDPVYADSNDPINAWLADTNAALASPPTATESVVVPREPTEAMLIAGRAAYRKGHTHSNAAPFNGERNKARMVYLAMLAANERKDAK